MSEAIHHEDANNTPPNKLGGERNVDPQFIGGRAKRVVVAGHICLDVIPTLADRAMLFAPGQTIEAGRAVFATGGAVANTGLALHKLGIATRLMGKVGSDLYGQAIVQAIEAYGHGLADSMVVIPDDPSSYSIILSTPNADRMLIHAPGCNATFGADDVDYDVLETVQLFHFGYPPLMERMYADNGAEMATLFQRVKAKGVTTSLDLSMPDPHSVAGLADWNTILSATLPSVDIFLPSAEEILLMLRRPIFDQLATSAVNARPLHSITPAMVTELGQMLLAMGAKIVGLKLGERGFYLCTANETALLQMGRCQVSDATAWSELELWSPCFATSVAGTTGSGDATIAGFLAALLRGMTPEETLTMACAVGACSVEAVDALSGIRSWQETTDRVAASWSRLPLALDNTATGWHWHDQYHLWVGPNDKS